MVETFHVFNGNSFAIRRVGHHHAVGLHLLDALQRATFEVDVFSHAGAFDVLFGNSHSLGRDVAARNAESKVAFVAVVVIDLVEQVGIKILPVFECKSLTEHTRIDVCSHQGSLDEESARAAHRVDEIALTIPAGELENAGSQHLVDRCFGLRHAIAAFVEGFAAGIEREGHLLAGDVHVELHVGVVEAN